MLSNSLITLIGNSTKDASTINSDLISYFNPKKYKAYDNNKYEEFWTGYCDLVQQKASGRSTDKLNIGEKVGKFCPVICDCSFKFDKNDTPSYFPDGWELRVLPEIIYAYQKAMKESLQIDPKSEGSEYIACVMAGNQFDDTGKLVYSYRIQFPFCRVEVSAQKRILRSKAIQTLRKRNIISAFPEQPIGDWENIISMTSVDDTVSLYGSVTDISKPDLSLMEDIYEYVNYDAIQSGNYDYVDINLCFSPDKHSYVNKGLLSIDSNFITNPDEHDIAYYIPFFLSLNYSDNCIRLKPEIDVNEMAAIHRTINTESKKTVKYEETDLDIAEQLLPMLSSTRVTNRHFCMDVGKALYNSDLSPDKKRSKSLWYHFSIKHEMSDDFNIKDYWDTFEIENALSVKTIAWYARIDSPSNYENWHKKKYDDFLRRSLSCTHDDVAWAFYWIYWLDYICGSVKEKSWYSYDAINQNIMKESDAGREIRIKISSEFKHFYEILQKETSDEVYRSEDEHAKLKYQMEIKEIGGLIKKLSMVQFKSNLMTALLDLFKDDRFKRFVNTNANLMGVGNGVLECYESKIIFRPGKPEDYITICTTVKYNPQMNWHDSLVQKVRYWFSQALHDEELVEYFLRLVGSCIRSKNKLKIMPILSGASGNNSKSMIKRLIELVFGPYSKTIPTPAFTRPVDKGPAPELMDAQFAKFAWFTEPSESAHIQADTIKAHTGMDRVRNRALYSNGGEYDVMYTLFLICNKIPIIPGADSAIMNRLRVIPFDSTWSVDAPDDPAEQMKLRKFKVDIDFESKIPLLTPAALWIFVHSYEDYMTKGLPQPPCVTKATEKYFKNNDLYKMFLKDNVEKVIVPGSISPEKPEGEIDKTSRLKISEIFPIFKSWARASFPSMKAQDEPLFLFHMRQRLGKEVKKSFVGFRIKETMVAEI